MSKKAALLAINTWGSFYRMNLRSGDDLLWWAGGDLMSEADTWCAIAKKYGLPPRMSQSLARELMESASTDAKLRGALLAQAVPFSYYAIIHDTPSERVLEHAVQITGFRVLRHGDHWSDGPDAGGCVLWPPTPNLIALCATEPFLIEQFMIVAKMARD